MSNGYTQTGGTFQTTDGLPEQFFVGTSGGGNATVSGGNIKMGTATTYGELDVLCAAFNLSGEYDPKVNGQMNGQCDKLVILNKSGFVNIQNGSTINVTVLGNLAAGQWSVIQGSTEALNNFTNKTLNGLTVNDAQRQKGIYELDKN